VHAYEGGQMDDLFENPMGLDGFEFVEFASPEPGVLEPVFELMGFSAVAKHRSKDVTLYRQGDINFILNADPTSHAFYFAQEHGPCACGMAFRVKDSQIAYARALENGAQPGNTIYDIDFEFFDDVDRHPEGCGFDMIDHLTQIHFQFSRNSLFRHQG